MFGVESGHGVTHLKHWVQCALGIDSLLFCPYNFSTGCIGHSPEHQALYHS